MVKKITAIVATIALSLVTAVPVSAEESIRKKATHKQSVKTGKWVTLDFKGKDYIKGNGNRSLFCYQTALKMKGKKKPKYVKLRLTRLGANGNNTTATHTYFVSSKPKSTLVFSNCWMIKTGSKVVVQVRVTGGSKSYVSDMRQFKMWTPGGNYPADFSDYIIEGTL